MKINDIVILREARVGNINQAISAFARLIEKHSGEKLYRYGGSQGIVKINHGIGILFLTESGKAYQFNYIEGRIDSITLWEKFTFTPGDYTIQLNGINLATAGQKLIQYVLHPRPMQGTISESKVRTDENYEKKRRASKEEFFRIIMNSLSPGQDIENLSREEINIMAAGAGVQVPTAVKHTRRPETKGHNMRFNLKQLISLADTPETDDPEEQERIDREKRLQYNFSIIPKDMETNKFESPKDNATVNKMMGIVQHAINKEFSPKEKEENVDELFKRLESLVKLVVKDHIPALVIYGGPGTGKTHTVKSVLDEEGFVKGRDWFLVKGRITTPELYKNLFIHRKNKIIVFDDTDSVWKDEGAANILKAALDSHDERILSWYSNRTTNVSTMSPEKREELFYNIDAKIADDPGDGSIKFPSEFVYDGRIIFVSNLSRDKFDDAVLTRSAKIDMTLSDNQMFSRIRSVLGNIGNPEVPIDKKEEILEFLIDEYNNPDSALNEPSMRSFVNAEKVYLSGLPNWKDLFYYI